MTFWDKQITIYKSSSGVDYNIFYSKFSCLNKTNSKVIFVKRYLKKFKRINV